MGGPIPCVGFNLEWPCKVKFKITHISSNDISETSWFCIFIATEHQLAISYGQSSCMVGFNLEWQWQMKYRVTYTHRRCKQRNLNTLASRFDFHRWAGLSALPALFLVDNGLNTTTTCNIGNNIICASLATKEVQFLLQQRSTVL